VWIWAAFRGQDGPNGAARVPVRPCFEHLRDFSDSFKAKFAEVRIHRILRSPFAGSWITGAMLPLMMGACGPLP
jgi:hypothetical protein